MLLVVETVAVADSPGSRVVSESVTGASERSPSASRDTSPVKSPTGSIVSRIGSDVLPRATLTSVGEAPTRNLAPLPCCSLSAVASRRACSVR